VRESDAHLSKKCCLEQVSIVPRGLFAPIEVVHTQQGLRLRCDVRWRYVRAVGKSGRILLCGEERLNDGGRCVNYWGGWRDAVWSYYYVRQWRRSQSQ
jgi:hypothetical protein